MKKVRGKFLLKRKINKTVNSLEIDDEFKPLVSEIMLRRAYQYNRYGDELEADLQSIKHNLKGIRICKDASEAGIRSRLRGNQNDNIMATYSLKDKKIIIYRHTLDENLDQIFQILSHEIYHVCFKDENSVDLFDKKNEYLNMNSNVFEEAIVEKASYRTVYPVENDYTTYSKNADGYADGVFVLDFVEATYGTNEQETIEHALNGRNALSEYLGKKVGEDAYFAGEFLEKIEVGATLAWSSMYNLNSKDELDEENLDNIEAGIESMFNICEEKLFERLVGTEIKSVSDAIKLKNEIAFCQTRLECILNDRINFFKEAYDVDFEYMIEKGTHENIRQIERILSDMEQIIECSRFSHEKLKFQAIEDVRVHEYKDEEFSKKFNIPRRANKTFSRITDLIEIKKEDKKYTEGWDNRKVKKMLANVIEKDCEKIRKDNNTAKDMYRLSENDMETYKKDLEKKIKERENSTTNGVTEEKDTLLDKEN